MVPLTTTYLEIFSCVCSDISNLAHKNSPKLAQINRLSAILLSGEFQENRIIGFDLKKIKNSYFLKHLIFDLAIWYIFVESPSETIAAKLSFCLPHARGTNCTTALDNFIFNILFLSVRIEMIIPKLKRHPTKTSIFERP